MFRFVFSAPLVSALPPTSRAAQPAAVPRPVMVLHLDDGRNVALKRLP